ncbi:uncharacterized protein LOC117639733 [Thrips palmi]|uniref:Uncharacterized protein LOC117639733 n=1 Tax=Thrips palmi TaxID=161013 RepID=A0A6P8Y4W9_THRPL|nr:uncharacterized protein LOC117639733 [Thrips palmi]
MKNCKHMKPKDFKFFTGLTQEQFEIVYELCGGEEVCSTLKYRYSRKSPKKAIVSNFTPRDRLFMTLIRLRRGIPLRDLSFVCGMSLGFASECVYTWIRLMSLTAQKLEAAMCLSAADQTENKPKCFKPFPNLKMIIDSTEFKVETPSNFEQQANLFSFYKKTTTAKVLIGISCYGGISFISEAFEGSISDKQIVLKSGLMDLLSPNDAIMADRGFDMEAEFAAAEVDLIMPPFLAGRDCFTARELLLAKTISSGRIHVERAIRRIREFRIVGRIIPSTLMPIFGDMMRTFALLINFQNPYIQGDKDEDYDDNFDMNSSF